MNDIEKYSIQAYHIVYEYEMKMGDQQHIEKLVSERLLKSFKDRVTQRIDKKYYNKRSNLLFPDPMHIYGIKGYLLSEEEMNALLKTKRRDGMSDRGFDIYQLLYAQINEVIGNALAGEDEETVEYVYEKLQDEFRFWRRIEGGTE